MELYVARQPIFDANANVVAYELLYRSGSVNVFDGSEENAATSRVITASFYSPGGREIMGGRPVFVNFPRWLLVAGGGAILPPGEVVIEILENVGPDREVLAACRALRDKGYRIALDDFVPQAGMDPLIAAVDYLKVDFRLTTRVQQRSLARQYGRKVRLLAEKVETREEFEFARDLGYVLFQGYFFARPVIVGTREIPGLKLNRLKILEQLQMPGMDIAAMGDLIGHEPALAYKLLRFVNSALFTVRNRIASIQQAILYIGEVGMRRWLPVVLLTDMNSGGPNELTVNALVRARFCELLAPAAGLPERAGDLFLLGLFSRLDAMYGRPLEELLSGLNLREGVAEILLGRPAPHDRLAAIWNTVTAYEQAQWESMTESAAVAEIADGVIPGCYAAAAKWADSVIRGHLLDEPMQPVPGTEAVEADGVPA